MQAVNDGLLFVRSCRQADVSQLVRPHLQRMEFQVLSAEHPEGRSPSCPLPTWPPTPPQTSATTRKPLSLAPPLHLENRRSRGWRAHQRVNRSFSFENRADTSASFTPRLYSCKWSTCRLVNLRPDAAGPRVPFSPVDPILHAGFRQAPRYPSAFESSSGCGIAVPK